MNSHTCPPVLVVSHLLMMDDCCSTQSCSLSQVGAGPVGLVAALTLLQNGIPVRIIDKDPNPRMGQRGPGIWVCYSSARQIAARC